jgi:hypothetical protein
MPLVPTLLPLHFSPTISTHHLDQLFLGKSLHRAVLSFLVMPDQSVITDQHIYLGFFPIYRSHPGQSDVATL